MGPPGAGKGTQAVEIANRYGIVHISTGAMFREAIAAGTELGHLASSYINKGLLVPDEVTIQVAKSRLSQPDCSKGFILDGFPRTLFQAEELEKMSKSINREIEVVINIAASKDELIQRISGRRLCKDCGRGYHIKFNKSKVEDVCDACGGELIQRKDDTIESLTVRLDAYEHQTFPLIQFYKEKGLLREVDGIQDITDVFKDIQVILDEVKK